MDWIELSEPEVERNIKSQGHEKEKLSDYHPFSPSFYWNILCTHKKIQLYGQASRPTDAGGRTRL